MRRIFYNTDLNEEFLRNGYVVVPFMDTDDIRQSIEIFEQYAQKSDSPFYLSIWNNDVPSRQSVHSHMKPLVEKKAKLILDTYKFLISCFAIKESKTQSSWAMHQDDSFTDESKYESLSIWIALTDVTESNGAMKVIDGSHNTYLGPRAPTISKLFNQQETTLLDQMKTVDMKAGEAIIFSHRLLHASGENKDGHSRIASVSVLIPEEAPVWFYYNQGGMVDVIYLNDDYYLNFMLGDRPDGKTINTLPLQNILHSHLNNLQ